MPLQTIQRHRLKFSALLIVALIGLAAAMMPWNMLAQEKIRVLLVKNGFADASLNLSQFGFDHVQIDTLRLAKDATALFDKLTLHFSPMEVVNGRVRKLSLSGLHLELQQTPAGWLVNGASLKPTGQPSPPLSIPVNDAQLSGFPLDSVELQDSILHVSTDTWRLDAPLVLQFNSTPTHQLEITSNDLTLVASGVTLGTAKVHATLALNKTVGDKTAGVWKGQWQTDEITIKGQNTLIPPMKGSGTLSLYADKIEMEGRFVSVDNTAHAAFNLSYPLNAPEKAQARLISAALPWNKGVLSTRNVVIPLNGKDKCHMTLKVEHVPVNTLMTMLTGKETLATGNVSGSIPITIKPDGQLTVGHGKLQTEQPGMIALRPETIPGDNEQIALVREIMKNLHYNLLSITMDGEPNKKLSVLMAVEGNNPDVVGGRPVKLNVHLTGDLLDFVQQSLLSLLDPHMFLKQKLPEQDSHAKP